MTKPEITLTRENSKTKLYVWEIASKLSGTFDGVIDCAQIDERRSVIWWLLSLREVGSWDLKGKE